jgi:hypothetical protein
MSEQGIIPLFISIYTFKLHFFILLILYSFFIFWGASTQIKNLIFNIFLPFFLMWGVFLFVEGGNGSPKSSSLSSYEEALEALSSLIIRRTRADGSNFGDQFDVLFVYLKVKILKSL